MNDIERYTTDVDGQLMQSDTGELVHYSDYLELKAKRDELLAALKKYGKHLDRCDSWPRHAHDQRLFSEMVCDCGLSDTIAKHKER